MKKLRYLILTLFIMFVSVIRVQAFSVTGTSTTTVGSTISIRVEASGLTGKFDISSSNPSVLSGGGSKWLENNTVTLYFTALKEGNATIIVNASNVSDENGNNFTGKRTFYVTVKSKQSSNNPKTQVDVNKKYSDNNYLKTLSIEGYELEPAFDKNKLEYSVMLPYDTENIKISATTEDKKASIKGIGEVSVSDGSNVINVVVTAENGNQRTYKLNVNVEEKDPIKVSVSGKAYTLVRKSKEEITLPEGFSDKKIKIEDQEITAYYSDASKIMLVLLKSEDGSEDLFIYENGKYKEFNNVSSNGLSLVILSNGKAPRYFKKTNIMINEKKLDAFIYKNASDNNHYILYALNLEDGSKNYYLYDRKNNTYQVYYDEVLDAKDEEIELRNYIIIGLGALSFILLLIAIFKKGKKSDKPKKQRDLLESFGEDNDIEKTIEIKKIDKKEYIPPRKSRKEKEKELTEARKKLNSRKKTVRKISLEEDE